METPLNITALNDFIFCPISIYFHYMYDGMERNLYQSGFQLNGTKAHEAIDTSKYSTSADILQGIEIYCEKYNLIGKIDLFNKATGLLVERKKKIKNIYDGYIYQLYGQCFALRDMGYQVHKLALHSMEDNKRYFIALPEDDSERMTGFEGLIDAINTFEFSAFRQTNPLKCKNCIYEPFCDRSMKHDDDIEGF